MDLQRTFINFDIDLYEPWSGLGYILVFTPELRVQRVQVHTWFFFINQI